MKKDMYPLVTAYSIEKDNKLEFLLPGRAVIVEGSKEVLLCLLRQCTGYRTVEEIVSTVCEQTNHNGKEVLEVIEKLLIHQILVDASNYFLLFHRASENPAPFF